MSVANISSIEQAIEDVNNALDAANKNYLDASPVGMAAFFKTLASKNITIEDWNSLVTVLGYDSSKVEILQEALYNNVTAVVDALTQLHEALATSTTADITADLELLTDGTYNLRFK